MNLCYVLGHPEVQYEVIIFFQYEVIKYQTHTYSLLPEKEL